MKQIIKFGMLTLIFFLAFACQSNLEKKPNIVWLVAEDQSQYFFPFYGDNSVNLPNISELLKNGTVFEGMNSSYPVCAPARSVISILVFLKKLSVS